MQTLYAADLTALPGSENLWRAHRSASHAVTLQLSLPADGFASPLGFWFAGAESWGTVITPLRVEVHDLREQYGWGHECERPLQYIPTVCSPYRARLVLKSNQTRPPTTATPLILEIDQSTARIGVALDSWSSVSEAVLIIVAQFWRFVAIDRTLDELAEWARVDLSKTGFLNLLRWQRSRDLHARRRMLQLLILDLPDFELYTTNPRAGLAPGRPLSVYRALARQLALDHRRRALDERVEVIEAVFDSRAESLNHLQALAFQVVLELAIVSLLILDVGVYFLNSAAR